MNNYTRREVFLFFVCGVVFTLAALLFFDVLKTPFDKSGGAGSAGAETAAAAKEDEAANDGGGASKWASLELSESPDAGKLNLNAAELQDFSRNEKENIAIYGQLNEAVVNITTETQGFNWFLEPVPQDGGSGSGSIIDTSGLVLTNYHVVEGATKLYINLADGTQIEGELLGSDKENDLAVIRFTPPAGMDLKTIPFGDSKNLKVGQKVLAIGNPFALERTLTEGIVSGLGRPIQISRRNIIRDMIQTDASINPGNSGGPLLDAAGKMIGINTLVFSPSGGSVGIGFAVPVDTAKRVVAEIRKYGKVRRGWIDATLVQLFPRLVQYAKLPVENGLLVSRTKRGGLAEKGGLKQGGEAVRYGSNVIYLGGDIITSVDSLKIESLADLYSALEDNKPGDKVDVEVLRAGKPVKLKITLSDREENDE